MDVDEFGALAVCGFKHRCTWRQLCATEAQAVEARRVHRARVHYNRNYLRVQDSAEPWDHKAMAKRMTVWLKEHETETPA